MRQSAFLRYFSILFGLLLLLNLFSCKTRKDIPDEYSENLGLLFAIPTIEVYLDNINTWTVPTGTVLSGLPVGRYRIVKDVDGWKYAEFVIE